MKATKYIITITVEVLDTNSVPALLSEVKEHMRNESQNGTLQKTDGDYVSWSIKSEPVSW